MKHYRRLRYQRASFSLGMFLRVVTRTITTIAKLVSRLPYRAKLALTLTSIIIAIALTTLLLHTRKPVDQLVLIRDPSGAYAYTGTIPQVAMKTSLGVKDDGINIKVERQNSSIEVITPLTSTSIKKDGNGSALYSSSDRNNTYKYNLTPTGLKEDIHLTKKPASNRFVSVVRVSNLVVNRTSDGLPVFTDTAGNYQFHFARPFAEDRAGNRTYNVRYTIVPTQDGKNPELPSPIRRIGKQHLSGLGFMDKQMTASVYTVVLDVDDAWLSDPKRIYPVTIDPTITHNTSSTFATGQTNRIFDTGSGSNPNLTTYYQELQDDPNTVALWHFNETSNGTCAGGKDACDVSGNANHGTVTGTTINTTTQILGGAARTFNGSSDHITVASSPSLNLTGDMTIEMWLNPSSTQLQYTDIMSKHGNGAWVIEQNSTTTNQYYFIWDTSGAGAWTCTTTYFNLTPNVWQHLAISKVGATASYYINGSLVNTCTGSSATISTNSLNLEIGRWSATAARYWNGSMDDIRISNTGRSPEEIKADAQRRPYAIYTSPIIDLGKATAFTSLAWDERGVSTGDGETASSSASLVAQWNFNETSGNIASVATGSCGSACQLFLLNFDSLGSQDALATGSGWTSVNRRWGAGALMFDGKNDTAYCTDANCGGTTNTDIGTGDFSVETWIKTNQTAVADIISKGTTADYSWELFINGTANKAAFALIQTGAGSVYSQVTSATSVTDGQWHHLVGTWTATGTLLSLYVDGRLDASTTTTTGTFNNNSAANLVIGGRADNTRYFTGYIDVTRVYHRALPPHEILSNYNAANMEFETRVGNSTTPDDGTWEAWKPVTSETQIDSMDSTARLNDGIYNSTYNWTIQNANNDQDWIKYNNAIPATCDSPASCGSNGSIGLGSAGKSDAAHVYLGSVILDAGTYKMWYTCHDGTHTRICYATSPDGLTWTKVDNVLADNTTCDSGGACAGNGMVGLGNANVGDNYHAYAPSVIKDGSVYKMWYTGYNTTITPNQWRIYYATSSSGLTWTKYDNTVPAASNTTGTNGRLPPGTSGGDGSTAAGGGVLVSSVIKDGSTYRMWYQGYDGTDWRVFEATSPDGLTWTKIDNTVPAASNTCSTNGRIPLGLNGTADVSHVQIASVIKDGNIYKMWYTGQDASNNRVIYATSTDALTWCKANNSTPGASDIFATDGRIPLGTAGDATHVLAGPVVKNGNQYLMWYSGYNANYRIYSARIANPPLSTSTDSVTKIEGTDSRYLSLGSPQATDNSVVALLHLDETSGTSGDDYFLKDSSGNGNHAGTVGLTTSVDGILGKARNFTGSQYLNVLDSASLKPTRGLTLEAWINPTSLTGLQEIIIKYNVSTAGYFLRLNGTTVEFTHQSATPTTVASAVTSTNKWYHVVGTWDGATDRIYVNGVKLMEAGQATAMAPPSDTLTIGAYGNSASQYFNGSIDEVRILNRAINEEEVQEEYRLGNNYRISKTIASTDLSSATKVPFYVASDRQGRIGDLTVGNSAFANWETDANTVGLWHFEENSGIGAYIKDASGNGASGTPTGTTFVNGIFGHARNFNGSSDVVTVPYSPALNPSIISVEVWVKTTDTGTNRFIIGEPTGCMTNGFLIWLNQNGVGGAGVPSFDPGNIWLDSKISISDGNWHQIAAVYDGTTAYIYVDGVLRNSAAATRLAANTNPLTIGGTNVCGSYFAGSIDEARISNVARTADQIRQAYEVGRRTHPIIVDFKAGLSSGGLITNSGTLSFTVDATTYGASSKGSNLYVGDKIIVREKVSSTTYIAQGTVTSVNLSTGAVTIVSWDAGSTFPTGGFTANATVFKWQREWFDPTGASFSTHRNAVTQLTFRPTNTVLGANIWLDDLRYGGAYLTTPTGSTITSSTGNRYFQYRAIESSVDTNVSSSLVSASLNYTANSPPNTPSLDSPSNTATNIALSPALKTTATDPDSDYIRYKIVLCTDSGMTTGCQTFDQTSSQTGWSGQNTQTSTAYTSGTQGTYTVQTALTAGTTYYWQSYAIDPGGTNVWSATQGAPNSFTTTGIPTAPTGLLTNGLTNPTGLGPGTTPYFSAVFNAPDASNTTTQAQIQVSTDSTLTGSVTNWDSGFISIASTAQGARSPNINYAGGTLAKNTTFYWRIRFKDASGNTGAWSSIAQFSTTQLFTPPCVAKKNDANTLVTVQWTNNNTVNDGYTIERSVDGAGFSAFGTTAASGTSIPDGTVANGHTYAYRVKATLGSQVSDWCTTATLSLQQGNVGFSSLRFF